MKLECKYTLFAALYAAFLLFWISYDSYTHDLYGRCDSAWYFMCGKAWMNGLTPYVDFTDSKGPFLWLIYGVGYLIDNHTYIGLFWIKIITYTISFYYCYKISRLYLSEKRSLMVAALMGFAFFNPSIHKHPSVTEDYCHPFIASGIFYILRSVETRIYNVKKLGLLFGICIGALFLIKFTIAAIFSVMVLAFAVYVISTKQYKQLRDVILFTLLSFFLFIAPFLFYFLYKGCLIDFISEYLIYTSRTVKVPLPEFVADYCSLWMRIFCGDSRIIFVISILASILFYRANKYKMIGVGVVFTISLAISLVHDMAYYTNAVNVGVIFLFLLVVENIPSFKIINPKLLYLLMLLIPVGVLYRTHFWQDWSFFTKKELRKEYYDCAYVMGQISNPRVVNFACYEFGLGTPVNALPGCKNFASQNGGHDNERQNQIDAIVNHTADFVISKYVNDEILLNNGYLYYCHYRRPDMDLGNIIDYYLYGIPGLKKPLEDFQVSNIDVLLKRRIKFPKE